MASNELRAAAERLKVIYDAAKRSGVYQPRTIQQSADECLLSDWAVQQLTAPADVETELRSAVCDAIPSITIAVTSKSHPDWTDSLLRRNDDERAMMIERVIDRVLPLLQRGLADDVEKVDEA